MRLAHRFVLISAISVGLSLVPVYATPVDPAEEAYYQIEANVFDGQQLESARAKIKTVQESKPDDPWIYLSTSLAVMVSGYSIGDWYSLKTFRPGTIDAALSWASKARELDPRNSQAQAHYARLLIVKGAYEEAWNVLNTAHDLAPTNFYPWYFRGIIAEKKVDFELARDYFSEAEKCAGLPHQHALVNVHLQHVAKLSGNLKEQEKLLKENIAQNPDESHYYGNYAHFLKAQKRYDESIQYWSKAIELGSYPEAITQLEETKRLRAGYAK